MNEVEIPREQDCPDLYCLSLTERGHWVNLRDPEASGKREAPQSNRGSRGAQWFTAKPRRTYSTQFLRSKDEIRCNVCDPLKGSSWSTLNQCS